MHGFPGCEIYLISQDAADPDTVHVTEVRQDEAGAQAALAAPSRADGPDAADVLALLASHLTVRTSPSWAEWASPLPTTGPDRRP
ncbi:hypothetical protein OG244_18935 [Streptomyces brevispora]|uniref:hypothetical protein n=1 Tax=Streptomyces brevispora TaxID=887462 RepID=UPI002E321E1D|nr:hypothetical protein [Streptomyces brevispora]